MDKTDAAAVPVAVAVAAASPVLGPYAIIALCALGGALWHVSRAKGLDMIESGKVLFRGITASLVFTGLIAEYLSQRLGHPTQQFFGPVSFLIALFADQGYGLARAWLSRKFGGAP